MDKGVIEFLIRAKRATYAGKGPETSASRPNSHDLHYSEGPLKYIDTYLGGKKFAGEEAVWKDGVPVWAMNYVGRATAEGFSGDFLKEALMLVTEDYPFRGPKRYESGEFTYICNVNGDLEWFCGYEEILRTNKRVYECAFHGGEIAQ